MMKITMHAVAIALFIGSTGVAAAHQTSPRHDVGRDFDAYTPQTRQPSPMQVYGGFAHRHGDDSHDTTTGGPVGGIN